MTALRRIKSQYDKMQEVLIYFLVFCTLIGPAATICLHPVHSANYRSDAIGSKQIRYSTQLMLL